LLSKIELGSNFDAASVMAISAMNLTASGDDTTSYAANYFPLQTQSGINIPSYPLAFLNNLNQINGESSRKVTYYSPKLGPLQFGISYIPDTGNLGGGSLKDTSDKYNQAIVMTITNAVGQTVTYSEKQPIKDAISTAITFNKDLSSTTNLSIAAVGEFGKAANPGIMTVTNANGTAASTTNYKLASLSTYNVGAQLNVGNYSFVASYVNQGKSMTSFQVFGTNRNSKFYTAGVAYTNDPLGASLTYSKADQYGNKMNIYTAGTSYKLAPGLAPYLEIAYFDGKAGLSAVYNNPLKQKFKATVAVIGIYLAF